MPETTSPVATLVWTECKECGLPFGYLRHAGRAGRPRLYCSAHNDGYHPGPGKARKPRAPRMTAPPRVFTCARCNTEFTALLARRKICDNCHRGKKAEVESYLRKHYPCREVPYGVLTELAAKFGISRERIRQIRDRMGFTYMQTDPDKDKRRCEECTEPTRSSSRWCREHRLITLPCAECDKPVVLVRAAYIATRAKHPIYSGRVFCDRVCYGRYAGQHWGWGNPDHPNHKNVRPRPHKQFERTCVVCGRVDVVESNEAALRTCKEHRNTHPPSWFRSYAKRAGAGE